MSFVSIQFLLFLGVVFVVFWLLPQKIKKYWLLCASVYFYASYNWKLIFLILATLIVSYGASLGIYKAQKKGTKILLLVLSLLVCLGILFVFKYINFLSEVYFDVVSAFDPSIVRGHFDVILPIGISFYTFQTLSYVIDTYKGRKPEFNFATYSTFILYFPQLVAGPIERPDHLIPQLTSKKYFDDIDFGYAFQRLIFGYFRKIAIADVIAVFVNNAYGNIGQLTGVSASVGTVLFAIQIYCDFSGYSEIAIGCSELFGIHLMENFDNPYKSRSIKEFWRRWHISLSEWLRDYIYFPMGGSRVPFWRWMINVLVVFAVSGLWHGAAYTFLCWGLAHGVLQILEKIISNGVEKSKIKINQKIQPVLNGLKVIFTFIVVCLTWVLFRAQTMNEAFSIYSKIFTDFDLTQPAFTNAMVSIGFTSWKQYAYVSFAVVALWGIDNLKVFSCQRRNKWTTSPNPKASVVKYFSFLALNVAIICCWIYLHQNNMESSFIYFQF